MKKNMQKRIIFLDVSGSVCFAEYWDTARTVLKASLAQDKNLDTYVCLFTSSVRLLSEKELQQLLNAKDPKEIDTPEFFAGIGSELRPILEFFPIDFIKDSKIEVISDFLFNEANPQEAKIQMQKTWESIGMGNAKVTFYELDVELVKLLTTVKQELETAEKKEEKTPEKTFEPTRKGKQ